MWSVSSLTARKCNARLRLGEHEMYAAHSGTSDASIGGRASFERHTDLVWQPACSLTEKKKGGGGAVEQEQVGNWRAVRQKTWPLRNHYLFLFTTGRLVSRNLVGFRRALIRRKSG